MADSSPGGDPAHDQPPIASQLDLKIMALANYQGGVTLVVTAASSQVE